MNLNLVIYHLVMKKLKKEKLYVLADVDFELELIYSNKINVHYILELLKK
ncbi:hypothetical protein HHA36_04285 [Spiroplasma citri]|nr:hypothetical protein HHA36_04285 [Spiroplasma citri]